MRLLAACFFTLVATATLAKDAPPSLFLEELTWPEVHKALQGGFTTVIIPTGGTEQNGAHMALGKHNTIVRYTAAEIARELRNTLVAPVISYVPEGNISPPGGHMQYAGTLSVREEIFEGVLEDAARSLKQHGFKKIIFIGDSGGNQKGQETIAQKLSAEWSNEGVLVTHAREYYDANGQDEWLLKHGYEEDEIGLHAGIEDTSELMFAAPEMVREKERRKADKRTNEKAGGNGDARKASALLGKKLLRMKVEAVTGEKLSNGALSQQSLPLPTPRNQ